MPTAHSHDCLIHKGQSHDDSCICDRRAPFVHMSRDEEFASAADAVRGDMSYALWPRSGQRIIDKILAMGEVRFHAAAVADYLGDAHTVSFAGGSTGESKTPDADRILRELHRIATTPKMRQFRINQGINGGAFGRGRPTIDRSKVERIRREREIAPISKEAETLHDSSRSAPTSEYVRVTKKGKVKKASSAIR